MNPLTASVLLAFAAAATWAPWRKPDWKSPAAALARFRALDDRDFAEYFVIGTLASLLHALLVAVGVRLLL